jgi:ribonuclease HII
LPFPNFEAESECLRLGHRYVAGVDEVGRGCLAGPVVAAAVILDPQNIPNGLDDSKKLRAEIRQKLDKIIRSSCIAFAIGVGEVAEIDDINIFNSSKAAMIRAVDQLKPFPQFLLVDGNFAIAHKLPQKSIIGGDRISVSIAAASIVAKVYRDALMKELDLKYPGYFFAQNKGYGSIAHRQVLTAQGRCEIHRKSFSWTPVRDNLPNILLEEEV